MVYKLLFITLLAFSLSNCFAQENSSGVFMTMKPTKNKKADNYTKIISLRDGSKKYYVPLNPVIPAKDFVKVSDLTNDVVIKSSYFSLFFTKVGIDNLKMMTSKLEGGQFILVVDGVAIGEIKEIGVAVNRSIQISGPYNSPDVAWAHENLQKMLEERK